MRPQPGVRRRLSGFVAGCALVGGISALGQAQPGGSLESPLLGEPVRLTDPLAFAKAGEAYFSPDGTRVVFQAIPVPPPGAEPDAHYSMYVADLIRDRSGRVTGIGEPRRVSREGSANTCGWFSPDGESVIFGSTVVPPTASDAPGYQRQGSRYSWQFPTEMEIVRLDLASKGEATEPLFERPGYDAECSYSNDGRFILYANVDESKGTEPDADLWIFDTRTGEHHLLIEADGYDGGPFFSPDGTRICYRSDRRGDDALQLFIADLKFDERGVPIGIEREIQITDNDAVNWAPYFHPSGRFVVYTSSELGHFNYEVVAIELPEAGAEQRVWPRRARRVTFAPGFDGLPVFSGDGSMMMWTSQRTGEGGVGTSQVWLAPVKTKDPAAWTRGISRSQAMDLVRPEIEPGWSLSSSKVDGEWIVLADNGGGTVRRFVVDGLGRVNEVFTSGG